MARRGSDLADHPSRATCRHEKAPTQYFLAEDRGFNFICDGTTGKGARPLPLATYPYFALSSPGVNFSHESCE